jgi:hypothetical protein
MAAARRSAPADSGETNNTRELAIAKLESSGLSASDAEALGIEWLAPGRTSSLGGWAKPLPALLLPYFDVAGKPLSPWPKHPPFYRLRYLAQEVDSSGFSVQAAKQKKPVRYVQPPNTSVAAYLARCAEVDWLGVLSDPDQPLVITEGELKAACACLRGVPTIGLGGVQSWRAIGKGVEFLPELEAIDWVGRHTYVCFDSDYKSNDGVLLALHELSEELVRRGAYAYVVNIPQVGDDKVGLDDYVVAEGIEAFAELLKAAEPLGLTKPLFDFNHRYRYVRNPGLLLDVKTGDRYTPTAFRDHLESTKIYQERALRGDGSVSRRPVAAAAAWLSWPLRAEVSRLTYKPGHIGAVENDRGDIEWSLWPGWGAPPAARATDRDVKPFLQLVDHLFSTASPEAKRWFLRWCAFPLVYPGTKMFSNVLIWGRKHGTGKSLIFYTLGRIYGENFVAVKKKDLHGDFNKWAEFKQLALGEEITGSDKREDADMIKAMTTQLKVHINVKYMPEYEVDDVLNWGFTANHPDTFMLEDDDRRSFIHEVEVGPLPEVFYVEYDLWLSSGGPALLHRWLLDLDLGDFNPAAPAFRTSSKERMIADTRSDLANWCRELLDAPDSVLRVGEQPIDKDLFTAKELLRLYDPELRTRTTASGLGRELKRAGCRQILDGMPARLADGGLDRLYAVRNPDKWAKAHGTTVTSHLTAWLKRQRGDTGPKRY